MLPRALIARALMSLLACAAVLAQDQQPAEAARSLRTRAEAAEAAGRFGEAADLFLQLVAAEPERPEFAIAAGRCLGRAGRCNDAMDLLDKKRQQFPTVLDLQVLLARTYVLKAESDPGALAPEVWLTDAAKLCDQVLAADVDNQEAALIVTQARFLLGDLPAALRAAESAVQRHPLHPGARILLGRVQLDRYRTLNRQLADAAPGSLDDNARAVLVRDVDALRQAAKAAFLKAVELDPSRPFPLAALGNLAAEDGNNAEALKQYLAALAIDPDVAVPHRWIEQHFDWKAREQSYHDAFDRYLQRPLPDSKKAATLAFYRARALYDGGQWQPALAAFQHVVQVNPKHINAEYYAAMAAWRLGDQDAAETHAAAYAAAGAPAFADVVRALASDLRVEVGEILQFLADRAFKAGRGDHSRDLNHVVACLRDSADAWNNFAFLCRETGRFVESFDAYLQAIEREPESPQLQNDAAVVLQYHLPTAANLQKARAMYERAIALADKALQRSDLPAAERERAVQARSDAKLNLEKLDKPDK